MIINVASYGGRTHMLDTARELAKLGHTVRFYSYVPKRRAVKFGLPPECSYSLFYWALPFLVLFKIFGFTNFLEQIYWRVFDVFTAFYMKPCDVFIGQSPMHIFSIKYAKRKYGAITILERGTIHVLDYIEQLKDDPSLKGNPVQPHKSVQRDLEGYKFPDYISVGSTMVKDTFIKHGVDPTKVFVNNYGVDLSQFHATELHKPAYDLIFVGQWSYRKGCDIITSLCAKYKYSFLHVGALINAFPSMDNMKHVDAIDQSKLVNYYAKAKVFIIPSRAEGLAMVQAQAAASGLPVVCSKYSGGADLKRYCLSPEWIIETDSLNIEDVHKAVDEALELAKSQHSERTILAGNLQEISWAGYGKRYNDFLLNVVKNRK